MTKFEFEERTGLKVTDEEYKGIEAMYYAVPNMEKDEFCKRWRQCGSNPLTVSLTNEVNKCKGMLEKQDDKLYDLYEKLNDLAMLLISNSCSNKDTDLYKELVEILGQKEVTLYKVKMALPLWEEDIDYIATYLH